MLLTPLIARQIVERANKIIQLPINVMDENALIIGSSDASRVGKPHDAALLVIRDNRTVEVDRSATHTLTGVKLGINLPIVYQGVVIGAVGISGEPEHVRNYAELVRMTAELIVEQAALMANIQWNKRHKEELLLQLINGSQLKDHQLLAIAEKLDLDLDQPRVAAVVKVLPKADQSVTLDHLQTVVQRLEYPERGNLVGIRSAIEGEIVVLKPTQVADGHWDLEYERKRSQRFIDSVASSEDAFSVSIAFGEYFPSIVGLSQSFETAYATLSSQPNSKQVIQFYREHKLSILLASIRGDTWGKQQLLQPIQALQSNDSKGVLFKTLSVFFTHNCDLMETCAELHIHRNTLRYRLEKIEQLTHLNLNNLDEKVQLYLALKCL